MKLSGLAARGMIQKQSGKIPRIRKDIARVLTIMKEKGLLNGSDIYSRFRLWRIDVSRSALELRLMVLTSPPLTRDQIKALPSDLVLATPQDRVAGMALMKDLEVLRDRCRAQVETSWVTPMGSEMYYRYQEHLTEDAIVALSALLSRPEAKRTS